MRLGIITLQPRYNFGGILQAYAMQEVLKKMGHETVLLDSSPFVSLPKKTRFLVYLKRAIKKYLLKEDIVVKIDKKINQDFTYIAQNTTTFINHYITKEERCKDFSDIKPHEFDGFIVGSDQIWRPKYFHTHIKHAYLAFTKDWNVKRIAYAASFGTDEWEYTPEETAECSLLAKNFNAISVREASAIELCKKRLEVDAIHVLDPTMLLTANDYIELFRTTSTPKSPGNIMCYILDSKEETNQLIDIISKQKELTAFYTNSKVEDNKAPIEERIQPSVETWLRGFYDAELIITDSFHACVFSILFKKPFIVYGNKERGMARFVSLLQMFGLTERLVTSFEEGINIASKDINWTQVDKLLTEYRKTALDFLKNHL